MESMTSILLDGPSSKSRVPISSLWSHRRKIKEQGEEVSVSLLRNSDEEDDFFDEPEDWDIFYAELALMDYNKTHHTDYKVVVDDEFVGDNHIFQPNFNSDWWLIHVQFAASDGHGSPKLFYAELLYNVKANEHIVTSVHFLNVNTTGCRVCDRGDLINCARSPSYREKLMEKKHNMHFPRAALALFNQNNNEEYEIVGYADVHYSMEEEFVAHCNFRAKRKTDSEPQLFFAEQQQVEYGDLKINTCFIIDEGKTTAGCYLCRGWRGKTIQHPLSGFLHGLTPCPRD